MISILWVDRNESMIEIFNDLLLPYHAYIHSFDCYDKAINFLDKDKVNIDLIISNYCLFYWHNYYPEKQNIFEHEKVCFNFFERVRDKGHNTPIILFSGINESIDFRIKLYERKDENFYYVEKGEKDSGKGIIEVVKELISKKKSQTSK